MSADIGQASVELAFDVSKDSPLIACSVVVKNFDVTNPKVFVDGKELVRGKDFYFSRADEIDTSKSIFFIRIISDKSTEVRLQR